MDYILLLTQNIEDSFETKKKAGVAFVVLTAAYETVWQCSLTSKLLRLLPDKHMIRIMMELVQNRRFALSTCDNKQSRLRRRKNGVPQGSVLAQYEVLVLKHCAHLPYLWCTQQLSAEHQSGVAALTSAFQKVF